MAWLDEGEFIALDLNAFTDAFDLDEQVVRDKYPNITTKEKKVVRKKREKRTGTVNSIPVKQLERYNTYTYGSNLSFTMTDVTNKDIECFYLFREEVNDLYKNRYLWLFIADKLPIYKIAKNNESFFTNGHHISDIKALQKYADLYHKGRVYRQWTEGLDVFKDIPINYVSGSWLMTRNIDMEPSQEVQKQIDEYNQLLERYKLVRYMAEGYHDKEEINKIIRNGF